MRAAAPRHSRETLGRSGGEVWRWPGCVRGGRSRTPDSVPPPPSLPPASGPPGADSPALTPTVASARPLSSTGKLLSKRCHICKPGGAASLLIRYVPPCRSCRHTARPTSRHSPKASSEIASSPRDTVSTEVSRDCANAETNNEAARSQETSGASVWADGAFGHRPSKGWENGPGRLRRGR